MSKWSSRRSLHGWYCLPSFLCSLLLSIHVRIRCYTYKGVDKGSEIMAQRVEGLWRESLICTCETLAWLDKWEHTRKSEKGKVHLSNKLKSQRRSLCVSLWEAVPSLQVLLLWDSSQASGGTPGVVIPEDGKWVGYKVRNMCSNGTQWASLILSVLCLTAITFQVKCFNFTSAFQIFQRKFHFGHPNLEP